MDWWLLTFFLGAILSLFLPEVPAVFQLFLLLCTAIGFYCHKNLRLSSGLWFGALWLLSQAYLYQNQLPNALITLMQNKQSFMVEGEVLSIQVKSATNLTKKQKTEAAKRFNFKVSKVNNIELTNSFIIRLSWKKALVAVEQGQVLSLNVKLKPAHGLSNVGSFNYVSWLRSHNISATGYVINTKNNNKIKKDKKQYINELLNEQTTVRQQLFHDYYSLSPKHELVPILMALSFGERSTLTANHWKVLQATGTSHLIAISGLHVGLLASGSFFMVMIIIRYMPLNNPQWQRLNARYLAITISLSFAMMYAYLAGFSLPTQRALVMLLLYWCSRLLGIKFSAKRLLLITVLILVIITPFSIFTVSFWLSFYAVVIIFLSLWRFRFYLNKGNTVVRFSKGLLIIQLALTLMLLPISAVFFQQISLVSLAANIIAVPWMSIVSIPCSLLSVLLMPFSEQLASWFMMLSLQSLTWLWQYLTMLSELSYADITLSWFQQAVLLCLGVIVFTVVYLLPFKQTRVVIGSVTFILISLFISFIYPNTEFWALAHERNIEKQLYLGPAQWQVIFFDVGQGLSVLIKQNEHGILYDTGAAYPSGFNMSEAVILPYLQYIGMNKLDKVIVSHSDNDHAGGLAMLENKIAIEEVISNDRSITNRSVSQCYRGKIFSWQGLTFEALSPSPLSTPMQATALNVSEKQNVYKSKNDDSCVLLISDKAGNTLLLTGDISEKIEKRLLINYPQLNVDILQVPHHGSKTSSSQLFLRQLAPQIALVSAGYLNRWRMPVKSIRQRYKDEKISLLNSAELGQVVVTIDENGLSVHTYVNDLRPFWFSH